MSYLMSQVILANRTIQRLSEIGNLLIWMKKYHPTASLTSVFNGYKFAVECCVNCMIDGFANDDLLDLEEDRNYSSATANGIRIHMVSPTCAKSIFLKNIKPVVKNVFKARDFEELEQSLISFDAEVGTLVLRVFQEHFNPVESMNLERDELFVLSRIDFAHTYLNQIKSDPLANLANPLSDARVDNNQLKVSLYGYAVALEFIWCELVGEDMFRNSHLSTMHDSDSWSDFVYTNKPKDKNILFEIMNREFDLEEQTCLDSHFYWIQKEITYPLAERYGFPTYSTDQYWVFKRDNYNRDDVFGALLDSAKLKDPSPQMNWEEKIRERLYWDYSIHVIEGWDSDMHVGGPSLAVMLAGTIALHDPNVSQFTPVSMVKFIHPRPKPQVGSEYSYGIYVDAQSAVGHYGSGWIIYQNACEDYSGFAGSEFRRIEKLMEDYRSRGLLEIRELEIPFSKFKEFAKPYLWDREQVSIIQRNKLILEIIQKSRASCLELFVYHACTSFHGSKFKIRLNSDKTNDVGEKDVLLVNDKEVKLIEVKLTPDNHDIEKEITKAMAKLDDFNQDKRSVEFWFWKEPSIINEGILQKYGIRHVVISNPQHFLELKGADITNLKFIMQNY